MNTIDIDLSTVPAKRLQPKEPTPRVQKIEDGRREGKQNLIIEGDAWTEKLLAPGLVEIKIPDITPWNAEEDNPMRVYRATFGESGHYRDLNHVRETLRDTIEIVREERAYAERLRLWTIEQHVLNAIEANPGVTTTRLREIVGGTGKECDTARNALLDRGAITVLDGPKNAKHHHLGRAEAVADARLEPGEVEDL